MISTVILPLLYPLYIFVMFSNMTHSGQVFSSNGIHQSLSYFRFLFLLIFNTLLPLFVQRNLFKLLGQDYCQPNFTRVGTPIICLLLSCHLGATKRMGISRYCRFSYSTLLLAIHLSGSTLKIVATMLFGFIDDAKVPPNQFLSLFTGFVLC